MAGPYYVYSGATGTGTGASWANAFTTVAGAWAVDVAGDTIYVAHDHSESTAAAITFNSAGNQISPTKMICVDRSGSVPPVSADRRTTAVIATTGASTINFNGYIHCDGLIFQAGNSTGVANIALQNATYASVRLDNCSLQLVATGAGRINFSQVGVYVELNNTTMSFSAVGQAITVGGTLRWRNTPSALLGTMPTILFGPATSGASRIECIGVDFSALGSGKTLATVGAGPWILEYRFIDCKLNAAVTKSVVPTGEGVTVTDFIRCGSSGNYSIYSHRVGGLLIEETTIVRSGGASDGTTPISWKIVTTASCNYSNYFECPPIAIWNDVTGSSVTATVEGIWGGGSVPNDDDVWVDVEYLGDASSPQASFVNDGKANLLATAAGQTSSSATWGGSTTKFKLNVSFTAQQKGWIYARVKCGKPSNTLYIDPLVTLT